MVACFIVSYLCEEPFRQSQSSQDLQSFESSARKINSKILKLEVVLNSEAFRRWIFEQQPRPYYSLNTTNVWFLKGFLCLFLLKQSLDSH